MKKSFNILILLTTVSVWAQIASYNETPNLPSQDSLQNLAKAVEIEEKLNKVIDYKLVSDEPYYTKLYYRLMLNGFMDFDLELGVGLSGQVDYQLLPKLSLHANYFRTFWALGPMTSTTQYNYISLPTAKPKNNPYIQNIEIGGSFFFSQQRKNVVLPQVFKVQHLFRSQVGNTTTDAYNASYFEHPVTIELSYGARAGVLIRTAPIYSDKGVNGFLASSDHQGLFLDPSYYSVDSPLQTDGWTNETSIHLYLGISRMIRKGSWFDVVQQKNNATYYVDGYNYSLFYADLMLGLTKSASSVYYFNQEYQFSYGDQPGQIDFGSIIGFRIGYLSQKGKGLSLPYSFEMGKYPGNGSWFINLGWGLGRFI